jgi:hypothetical protein
VRVEGFVRRKGLPPNRRAKNVEEAALGAWCKTQKDMRRMGRLYPEREKKMEAVPGWRWRARQGEWRDTLEDVREFAAKRDFFPRYRAKDEEERRLARWCTKQRERFERLSVERRSMLESMPGWRWRRESC